MPGTSGHPSNPSDTFAVEAYVTQTAELLGLSIPPEQMERVIENFESIQAIAQPVLDFPLPDTLEAAPTFEP
ncbi:MAG: DUF4089 domain-containing protein [Cyanobacteria bacterium P01_A01_bin.17]